MQTKLVDLDSGEGQALKSKLYDLDFGLGIEDGKLIAYKWQSIPDSCVSSSTRFTFYLNEDGTFGSADAKNLWESYIQWLSKLTTKIVEGSRKAFDPCDRI